MSRFASGWKPMSAGSGRPFITIAPRSLPRYLSKSSFDFTSTTTGVPVSGEASAGDHARG